MVMWDISSGYPPFKHITRNNEKTALAIAIATNEETREAVILGTPKDYEELYKKCWSQEPEQRPTIKEVLKEFSKMGFGIIIQNTLDTEIAEIAEDPNSPISKSQNFNFLEYNN